MNRTVALALGLVLCFSAAAGAQDDKPTDVKLEPLFNGKDLAGWTTKLPECWKVVDGVLTGQSNEKMAGDVIKTEKSFSAFALEAEVRFPDNIDSGFIYAKPELQVQLGVSRSLKKDMTCSIYYKGKYPGQAQGVDKLLKLDQWNTVRYELKGKTTRVWLNGQHVLTWECPDEVAAAPIGLQIHGGVKMKVEFRNIRIAELK